MSKTIPSTELEKEFHVFLAKHEVGLDAVSAPELFRLLVAYFDDVRVEGCDPAQETDYLHFESGGNSFYFERLLYIPWDLLYPDDEDADEDDPREKWGMSAGPEIHVFAERQAPQFPTTNLWSFDFPDSAAFAQAALKHPAMQWAAEVGPLPSSTFHDQVG